MERFNLTKLSELDVRKRCKFKIAYDFAALKNISGSEDINGSWENIKQNNKTSAKQN